MEIHTEPQIDQLKRIAASVRSRSLRMVHQARLGHPGGDFSSTDILVTLYFAVMRGDEQRRMAPGRDRFVMSKGHCSGALYATLATAGYFPQDLLDTYMQPLSLLNGHPDRNKAPGVEANTGPLGHGLPIATGMAISAKITSAAWRTFVLTGDGELQEGSNWEAAMTASHYGLDNLTLIVDRNRIQQGAPTEETVRLEPLADRFRAFGWAVEEVDGHDYAALLDVLQRVPFVPGKPNCVIAHTHKGNPVSFMMDRAEWHHKVPSDAQLAAALEELGA